MEDGFHGSLREKVFTRIEEDIINGRYAAGQKLTESMLSKDLNVSRTPVREALSRLEIEGLVEAVPNKAVVVAGITSKDIEDIYEIRISIEGLAARRAAENITDEELQNLGSITDMQEFFTGKGDLKQLVKLDGEFHHTIFKASGSKTLKNILTTFHHNIKKARGDSFSKKEGTEKILEEHRAVFEAIKRGDSEKAEEHMIRHVKNAKKRVSGK